jgi:dienelactone hydrolase
LTSGCSRPDPAPTGARGGGWIELDFPQTATRTFAQRALAHLPTGAASKPVVIALHGRGEASKGLAGGSRGFRDDYRVDAVRVALEHGAVTSETVGGFEEAARLERIGAALAERPYEGVVLVTPFTPVPSSRDLAASPFAAFVTGELLKEVDARRGVSADTPRTAVGIDGISMGGRYALVLGFSFPEVFDSVGGLQPAIAVDDADALADLALRARATKPQKIRLCSSSDDPFLEPTRALSRALEARGVAHQLVITGGPHDYAWNRGPGALELLLFHERAARGLDAP